MAWRTRQLTGRMCRRPGYRAEHRHPLIWSAGYTIWRHLTSSALKNHAECRNKDAKDQRMFAFSSVAIPEPDAFEIICKARGRGPRSGRQTPRRRSARGSRHIPACAAR